MFLLDEFPFIYFKSKIILLDDDDLFFDGVVDSLKEESMVEFYTDAHIFINRLKRLTSFWDICLMSKKISDESTRDIIHFEYNIEFFIKRITEIYKSSDFISMVFIDYMMPNMNGLECSKKLGFTDYSKILLTASLDNQDIIQSFNQKKIDGFIKKTDVNLIENLKDQISFNHINFLKKINMHIKQVFFCDYPPSKIYKSSDFQEFLSNFIIEKEIQFYCLYEKKGSLLMFDKNCNTFLFNIYEEIEIEEFIFSSYEFENLLSDMNRKRCENLEIIVDYKNPYNLGQGLEKINFLFKDITTVIKYEGSPYYIVLSKI